MLLNVGRWAGCLPAVLPRLRRAPSLALLEPGQLYTRGSGTTRVSIAKYEKLAKRAGSLRR